MPTMKNLALAVFGMAVLLTPQQLRAQHFSRAGITQPGSSYTFGGKRIVSCNSRALTAATSRRSAGGGLAILGAALVVWSVAGTQTTQTQFGPVVEQTVNMPLFTLGVAGLAYGAWMYLGQSSDNRLWDEAVGSLTIGQSSISDAHECLGAPVSTAQSTATGNTVLTYVNKVRNESRTYRLTFKRGVLSDVEQVAEEARKL